jgi:adenine phosphoribosyltransferase
MTLDRVQNAVRDIPDFPKPGIVFKDITPVLGDPALFAESARWFADRVRAVGAQRIVAVEARGFLFGAAAAALAGAGIVPVRKKGKLPFRTLEAACELEYGSAVLAMHVDALKPGERVLIVDDVLATGGTARAVAGLVEQAGAAVAELAFLIELSFLHGRGKLDGYAVSAAIVY